MTVVSISLTPDLLKQIDELVTRSGYSSRSEVIRLSVRDALSRFALQRFKAGMVMATVTVVSDRVKNDISARLLELRHGFEANVFGNMHLHIGEGHCVEVFLVQGDVGVVSDFISRVRAVRGITEAKYTITPIEMVSQ